jgi:ribosome-associated protein
LTINCMLSTHDTALLSAEAADNKKAFDILILDIRRLTYITDYFVICSGSNITQVAAIADGIGQALAQSAVHPSHIEGQTESSWILMDYGDVIVHIFDEQTRLHYALEKLWSEAVRVPYHAGHQTVQTVVP